MHAGLRGLRFPHARRALACLAAIALAPASLPAVEDPAVTAINQFGLSCQKLTKGNSLISPWSLQQSLGMTYAGAAGETRTAMAKALGYTGDDAKLFAAFEALVASPRSEGEGQAPGAAFKNANRLFVSGGLPLEADWRKLVQKTFSADAQALDFADRPKAEKTINEWVKSETGAKIPAVIPNDGLSDNTQLVLVNALSFEQSWEESFPKEKTVDAGFQVAEGKWKTVPMMSQERQVRYASKDAYQIVAIPYAGGACQFVAIVPRAVTLLPMTEDRLTPQILAECTSLPLVKARVFLPRLKMAPPVVRMKEMLTQLGMGIAFDPKADFSGLAKNRSLWIDNVFHRAYVEINEEGTKAAASTATVVVTRGGGAPLEIHANRPFLFLIQDVRTGACLFMGRVVDPAPEQQAKDAPPPPRPPAKEDAGSPLGGPAFGP